MSMELRTSPHGSSGKSVESIMAAVVFSLLPLVAFAFYLFGLSALALVFVCTFSALLTEYAWARMQGKPSTLGDFSGAITGLLLGLTLPPGFPLWMGAVGGIISIALGKSLFGGLGYNIFNPALVGRAFLQAAFPVSITTWVAPLAPERFFTFYPGTLALPLMQATTDAATGATPLGAFKFENELIEGMGLWVGQVSGSLGETSVVLIALGGLFLVYRKMLDWRIPVGILATVAALSALLHGLNPSYPPAGFMLGAGGLMLGAVFMATDMVTSPVTPLGVWLFAVFVGAITVVIRVWGGLPEGVMYAILLGNALTPLLNRFTQPRIYGARP